MSDEVLRVEGLAVSYGESLAVQDVSLSVEDGSVVALLGRNGVGKSTTFRAISGIVRRRGGRVIRGRITYRGEDITNVEPSGIVRRGLVQVLEGRHVLSSLTVRDNLRLGAYVVRDRAQVEKSYDQVLGLFPRLAEKEKVLGGLMSGGEQQMLAIGRALMSRPRMVLMDEPSLGLAPLVVAQIARVIRDIAETGVTVLVVEQNATMALSIADTAYVLDEGRVALQGSASELKESAAVVAAYIGLGHEDAGTSSAVPTWARWVRA
jgi:branched-chain amino acid transport system ATP-binding protein